jgi:hypothetical protein
MLTQEYRHLIAVLIEKTDADAISWQKGGSRFSYQAKARENTFKVDKYFAGDSHDACLNLSAFDERQNLVLEIVLCRGIEDQKEDYGLVSALYSKVELRANNAVMLQEIPVVASITQSLQQVV